MSASCLQHPGFPPALSRVRRESPQRAVATRPPGGVGTPGGRTTPVNAPSTPVRTTPSYVPGTPVQRIRTPKNPTEPVGATRSCEHGSVVPSPASITRATLGNPLGAPTLQMRIPSSPLPSRRSTDSTPRSVAAPPPQVSRDGVPFARSARSTSPTRLTSGASPPRSLHGRCPSPSSGALRGVSARSPSPSSTSSAMPSWPSFAAGQVLPFPQQAPALPQPAAAMQQGRSLSPCNTSFVVAPALGRAGSFQSPVRFAFGSSGPLPVVPDCPAASSAGSGGGCGSGSGGGSTPCRSRPHQTEVQAEQSAQGSRAQSPNSRGPTQRKRWLQDIVGTTVDSQSSLAAPPPGTSSLANLARNAVGTPHGVGVPAVGLRR